MNEMKIPAIKEKKDKTNFVAYKINFVAYKIKICNFVAYKRQN